MGINLDKHSGGGMQSFRIRFDQIALPLGMLCTVGAVAWLLVICLPCHPFSTSERTGFLSPVLIQAQQDFMQAHYAKASEEFETILAHDPNNIFASYGLADDLASWGKTNEAVTQYRAILLRGKENSFPNIGHLHLALTYIQTGDEVDAISEYNIVQEDIHRTSTQHNLITTDQGPDYIPDKCSLSMPINQVEASIHLALGVEEEKSYCIAFGGTSNALRDISTSLRLVPESDLNRFYFAYVSYNLDKYPQAYYQMSKVLLANQPATKAYASRYLMRWQLQHYKQFVQSS